MLFANLLENQNPESSLWSLRPVTLPTIKQGGLAFLSSFLYSSFGSSDELIIFECPA